MNDNATITLRQFLAKGKTFVIPNYQRGYVWGKSRGSEKDSVEYLLESIENILTNNTELFLQGITVTETDNEIKLIDGQQRTTFFYLLLTCLNYQKPFNLNYPIRTESDTFLKSLKGKSRMDLLEISKENSNEEYQDIFYFKKTIWKILNDEEKQYNTSNWDIDKILDQIKFLDIDIADDKATLVFSMMNGSKADMKTEEIIKAEMLRLVSSDKETANNPQEAEALHWEQNLLRSKYAREWDKWLYWWNREDVAEFYHTGKSIMGLLVTTYLKSKGGLVPKEGRYFEQFRDKLLRGVNNEIQSKKVFYDLRHLQKKFEDVFNDNRLYNTIGAILTLHNNEDRDRFVQWYFTTDGQKDLDKYYKLVFLGLSHTVILTLNNEEQVETAKEQMLQAISSDNLYNENSIYAFMQLLRRNIEEDTKLGRKFNFSIWNERSLEHIFPKSKVYHCESDGKKYVGVFNQDKEVEIPVIEKDMLNRADFNGEGSEHCIGNLVLLYKNENSKFGAKSFDDKKSIYFNVNAEKPFKSRHLLHTISVFTNKEWGVEQIVENKKQFITEIKNYYGIQ